MLELKTNAKYNLAKASVNIRGGTNKSSTLHLPHCHFYTCLCKYETTPVFVAIKNILLLLLLLLIHPHHVCLIGHHVFVILLFSVTSTHYSQVERELTICRSVSQPSSEVRFKFKMS